MDEDEDRPVAAGVAIVDWALGKLDARHGDCSFDFASTYRLYVTYRQIA